MARFHDRGPWRTVTLSGLVLVLLALPGCMTFTHKVGGGADGGQVQTQAQWYAIYGLVPIGKVDSAALAAGDTSYTVTTKFTFVDVVITAFTSFLTFYKQTVIVES